MKILIGLICSVLGAAIAFYLTAVTLISLPPAGAPRWIAVIGLVALSLIAGVLVNGGSIINSRQLSKDLRKTSNIYNILTSRLGPLLYSGMEDVLLRRVKTLKPSGQLNFSVLAPIHGLSLVVGSTFPPEDPIRQIEMEPDEGVPGFFGNRKVPGFSPAAWKVNELEGRTVFDRAGQPIGEASPLRAVNKGKISVAEKWLYCRPIFERSTSTPWSNRLVGTLLVHSRADDANSLFKTEEFQHLVDSVASEASPYLDAIQIIMAEEKP